MNIKKDILIAILRRLSSPDKHYLNAINVCFFEKQSVTGYKKVGSVVESQIMVATISTLYEIELAMRSIEAYKRNTTHNFCRLGKDLLALRQCLHDLIIAEFLSHHPRIYASRFKLRGDEVWIPRFDYKQMVIAKKTPDHRKFVKRLFCALAEKLELPLIEPDPIRQDEKIIKHIENVGVRQLHTLLMRAIESKRITYGKLGEEKAKRSTLLSRQYEFLLSQLEDQINILQCFIEIMTEWDIDTRIRDRKLRLVAGWYLVQSK